jgi:20S proteasome alpha/beta subunit
MVPKPTSLPKNRRREKSRMTICLGMVAHDGIVIAADAEESDSYFKRSQQKIMTWQTASSGGTHTPAGCVMTGAGDAGFIDAFIYDLMKSVGQIKNIPEFESYFKKRLEAFYSKHVLPFSTINPDYDFKIIAGVYFGYMTSLFVTYKSTVRHGAPYTAIGVGDSFALSMMDNIIDFTSVSRSELLAANVITSTKGSIPGCGKYTDVVTIHNAVTPGRENEGPSHLEHPSQIISRVPWQKIHRWEDSFSRNWLPRQQALFADLMTEELTETDELFKPSASRKSKGRR